MFIWPSLWHHLCFPQQSRDQRGDITGLTTGLDGGWTWLDEISLTRCEWLQLFALISLHHSASHIPNNIFKAFTVQYSPSPPPLSQAVCTVFVLSYKLGYNQQRVILNVICTHSKHGSTFPECVVSVPCTVPRTNSVFKCQSATVVSINNNSCLANKWWDFILAHKKDTFRPWTKLSLRLIYFCLAWP